MGLVRRGIGQKEINRFKTSPKTSKRRFQGGKRNRTVKYTGTQSFISAYSNSNHYQCQNFSTTKIYSTDEVIV